MISEPHPPPAETVAGLYLSVSKELCLIEPKTQREHLECQVESVPPPVTSTNPSVRLCGGRPVSEVRDCLPPCRVLPPCLPTLLSLTGCKSHTDFLKQLLTHTWNLRTKGSCYPFRGNQVVTRRGVLRGADPLAHRRPVLDCDASFQ